MLGNREKYLALAVILVLAAYVADRLILTPALAAWRRDGERLVELRRELAAAESLVAAAPGWREEQERRRQLAFPELRAEAENAILKVAAGRAVDRHIQLKGIRPSWREAGTAGKGLPAQLELSVSASGSMAAVAGFLYDLETMPGPVRVDRTRIHSRTEDGRVLDLDLTLAVLPGEVLTEDSQ